MTRAAGSLGRALHTPVVKERTSPSRATRGDAREQHTWTRSLYFRRVCVCAWYRSWFTTFTTRTNKQTNERTTTNDDDGADAVFREKNGVKMRACSRTMPSRFVGDSAHQLRRRRLERLHAARGARRRRVAADKDAGAVASSLSISPLDAPISQFCRSARIMRDGSAGAVNVFRRGGTSPLTAPTASPNTVGRGAEGDPNSARDSAPVPIATVSVPRNRGGVPPEREGARGCAIAPTPAGGMKWPRALIRIQHRPARRSRAHSIGPSPMCSTARRRSPRCGSRTRTRSRRRRTREAPTPTRTRPKRSTRRSSRTRPRRRCCDGRRRV